MAKLGGFSKLSFKLGGEPSNEEKAYKALLRMVGEGGSPPNDPDGETTLDGVWRRAKAIGLGALVSVTESALYQGFPNTVTDELRSYEEIVNVFLPSDASDEERRLAVLERWVADNESNYPAFTDSLEALDSRFSVLTPVHANARYTYEGKVFDTPGNKDFDQYHDHSKFPNFADEHVVAVLFDVGEGIAPAGEIGMIKTSAETLIGEALPAWNDFVVLLDVGFTLDLSLLDVTGFSP
jgi:hypothetical protein